MFVITSLIFGSGLTVTVTVNELPSQPLSPIGTNVYTTSTFDDVSLVHTSAVMASDNNPSATTWFPDAPTNPLFTILVKLYVATKGVSTSPTIVYPKASSLQTSTV